MENPITLLSPDRIIRRARAVFPGLMLALVLALAAKFLSEHYGMPAMLMALLLGIAFNFLSHEGRCVEGIEFTARTILRIGVALLGVRITADLVSGLGFELLILIPLAVALTTAIGILASRLLGQSRLFGLLTGGSVAICGASAAMAISAVLPKDQKSEQNLIFTILGVTLLSTLTMIFYPIVAQYLGLSDTQTGIFLGLTIHDVAQVVGAGFSVSPEAGETAILVKLMRVTMLAPVVLIITLIIRKKNNTMTQEGSKQPPLLPVFVLVFMVLAAITVMGGTPEIAQQGLTSLSNWALLSAIAAVGVKTSLKTAFSVGPKAILLIVIETGFIALFALVVLYFFL